VAPSPDRTNPNREICFGPVRFGLGKSWSDLPCCRAFPPTVNRGIPSSEGLAARLSDSLWWTTLNTFPSFSFNPPSRDLFHPSHLTKAHSRLISHSERLHPGKQAFENNCIDNLFKAAIEAGMRSFDSYGPLSVFAFSSRRY
jgi:hypothetical protein